MILILSSLIPKAEKELHFIMFTVFFFLYFLFLVFRTCIVWFPSHDCSRQLFSLLGREAAYPASQFYNNCFRIFPKLKWITSLCSHCLCFLKWNSSYCTPYSLLQGIIQNTQIPVRVFLPLANFPFNKKLERRKSSKPQVQ